MFTIFILFEVCKGLIIIKLLDPVLILAPIIEPMHYEPIS